MTIVRMQRGQSTIEFAAALLALLPLFFGVIYLGKFADIKHQAIQASRFVAFERAYASEQETDGIIEDEARERFFADPSVNGGRVGFQDNTAGMPTAATLNPNWNTLEAVPLIQRYSDVEVQVPQRAAALNDGAFAVVEEAGSQPFSNVNQDTQTSRSGQIKADVTVAIVNIDGLPAPLNTLNLSVAATTVIAGDAWNGGGTQDVANRQSDLSVPGKALQQVFAFLDPVLSLFVDHPPVFGCDKPDVVPDRSAPGAGYAASNPCY